MAAKFAKITLSTARKALQSVIAPDIIEIKGSIKILDTKLDDTNTRIDDQGAFTIGYHFKMERSRERAKAGCVDYDRCR